MNPIIKRYLTPIQDYSWPSNTQESIVLHTTLGNNYSLVANTMQIKRVKIESAEAYECYVDMFSQYFYVIFGYDNWVKYCEHDDDFAEFKSNGGDNGCVGFNKDTGRILVYFRTDKFKDMVAGGTLPHEAKHLAMRIFEHRGIKRVDEELEAHMIGYICKSLLPLFKR